MFQKTALVIDSASENITIINQALRPFNAVLLWAETLKEGLALLAEARPQLVFVASSLPGLAAPQDLLKAIDALKLPAQLVVLEREPDFEAAMSLVVSGVFAVASVPLERAKLAQIAQRALEGQDLLSALLESRPLDGEKELAIHKRLAGHRDMGPLAEAIRALARDLGEGAQVALELAPGLAQASEERSDEGSMFTFEGLSSEKILGAPLVRELSWKGRPLGKILWSYPGGRKPQALDEDALDELAWAAGQAIDLAREFQEATSLASRDPLTGLQNRRAFTETLEREFARAKRHNTPLSLLILDIDHFKSVNDNFGHQTGDKVLKWLGKVLRDTVRVGDAAARIGGEEFAVILPWTDLEQAQILAQRLKDALRASQLPTASAALRPTVSQGIATIESVMINSPEDLIYWSDQAMYLAKKEGRDAIRVATDLPRSGAKIEETPYVFQ
ncbi:MAG: GGDEF domain-containing protein [Deltaproteobacteria bacterium]|jgi:diguanylate cyclase (GGDEF)-like protein|nr:GGDEF domain-containing protein [Deltaproteobacteria bacterium]